MAIKDINLLSSSHLYPSLVYLAISFSFIFFLVYTRKPSKSKFPPGSRGWPIIGENLEFAMAAWHGTPEKFVNDRKGKYKSDIFQTSILGERMVVFCGAAANKFVFSTGNQYLTAWLPLSVKKTMMFPETLRNSSEDESDNMLHARSLIREGLRAESLKNYIPVMDSMAKEHLQENWFPNKQVKVVELTKIFTFSVACRLFLNITDSQLVKRLTGPFAILFAGTLSLPVNFPGTAFWRALKEGRIIRKELLGIVKQRRKDVKISETNEDLLSRAILALGDDDGDEMSIKEMEIGNIVMSLLVASYDTTSTSLTFFVNYLAENPHVYKEVFREQMEIAKSKGPGELLNWGDVQKMKYSWCACCESMRLSPPAQGAFREVTNDFTFSGFTIPKGLKVHWTAYSTHKDPKIFPNPEKFDPSRFEGNGPPPYTFVPFGGGPRMCPGKEYARFEILVFIHNLVTKFEWEKIIPDEKIVYTPLVTLANGLPVRIKPHHQD
ncbi:beta-amyrin 6-beta-monooxygenase-like [Mercurialis annua]|uniref:beta-amyrin 6-beta-monooxygenase-like n=1 Tax=Mercurialis annua TaxID=3986 RepID=UPI00215E2471|nr:beta-amyrin 6-beta-monooxygenase-like [Mercurialis annua]XP_050210731.1 beta-amyrin 6-beta-monooxygenase-like [Mercurialis annua]